MMNESHFHKEHEIDLIELFKKLWVGKWKIMAITFIAALIGVFYSVVKPNSFEVSTPFQSAKESVFLQYTPLNDLLKGNQLSHSIDKDNIFKIFIVEFNDYEEMIDALSRSEFVQKSIKNLDDLDKQNALIGFAKSFELRAPSKNETNWVMSIEWHDNEEGVRLLNDAIQQTLLNIKNTTKSNVDDLAQAIEIRNRLNLEKLRNELSIIKQFQIDRDKKRIQFLIEQSAIAKELGIETNGLDADVLSQTSQNGISFSLSSNDVPFYLRGYKAIDKEILLIQNRTEEEKLLATNGFIETKERILSLEKDLSSSQLRNASEIIATDKPDDWIEFNLAIADVISQKKSMLYVALSIVLGGMVGVLYVLISNAIHKRKE